MQHLQSWAWSWVKFRCNCPRMSVSRLWILGQQERIQVDMGLVRPGAGGCAEGVGGGGGGGIGGNADGVVGIQAQWEERWQDVPTPAKESKGGWEDAQTHGAAPLPRPEGKGGEKRHLCLLQTFIFDSESRWAQESLMSSGRECSWPPGCRVGTQPAVPMGSASRKLNGVYCISSYSWPCVWPSDLSCEFYFCRYCSRK